MVEENFDEPGLTLLSFVRRRLGLCGTKLGCGEGGCGACTVMVSDLQVSYITAFVPVVYYNFYAINKLDKNLQIIQILIKN